jgi:hypothetical protein
MKNWKGFGSKRLWPNVNYYPGICSKETMINLSQDSWSLGQDFDLGPPQYDTGVLKTRLRCEMWIMKGMTSSES